MTTLMQAEPQTELTAIEMMIGAYVRAIDTRDIAAVEQHLHPEFRAIAASSASPGDCQIISRAAYIGLLSNGKIGGEQREVNVQFAHINGANAVAYVRIENEQKLFLTYYNLIRKNDNWLLISDMPILKTK
jgi:hypothetical protein